MKIQFSSIASLTVGMTQRIRISGLMVPVVITGKRRHHVLTHLWTYEATSTEVHNPKESVDDQSED